MPLYTTADLGSLWPGVVQHWFQDNVPGTLRKNKPVALLTPGRQLAYVWRQRWMQESGTLFGMQFWMPKDARTALTRLWPDSTPVALREETRLLLSLAAQQLLAEQRYPAHCGLLRSILSDPAALLTALDTLRPAGWDADALEHPVLQELVRRAEMRLSETGALPLHRAEEEMIQRAAALPEKPLGPLLIAGFDATHWPLWRLLRLTATLSEEPTVILPLPRISTEGHAQIWNSSWETFLGEASPAELFTPSHPTPEIHAPKPRKKSPTTPEPAQPTLFSETERNDLSQPETETDGSIPETPHLNTPDSPQLSPFQELADSLERQAAGDSVTAFAEAARVQFRVAAFSTDLVPLILAQVRAWLREKRTGPLRIGLIFPSQGPLPRAVSQALTDAGLLHNDALGSRAAPGPDADRWRRWLDVQRELKLGSCLELLLCLPELPLPYAKFEQALRQAYQQLLSDRLPLLIAALKQKASTLRQRTQLNAGQNSSPSKTQSPSSSATSDTPATSDATEESSFSTADAPTDSAPSTQQEAEQIADWFQKDFLLPETASLEQFCARSCAWLRRMGDPARAEMIQRRAARLSAGSAGESLDRSLFIRWLTEISDIPGRMRQKCGAEPFAPIQLLPYAEAEGQALSHALLAGLSQGEYPPPFRSSGLLTESRVKELNARAIQSAESGLGELCVKEGHALMWTEEEQRRTAQQTFISTVASLQEQLCAVACAETAEGKAAHPGPLFFDLYSATHAEPPHTDKLVESTQLWLQQQPAFITSPPESATPACLPDLSPTLHAYRARRDASAPFGPYDFSLDAARPKPQLTCWCKEWEEVFQKPGSLWIKKLLHTTSRNFFYEENPAALTCGTWIHRWLQLALKAGARAVPEEPPGAAENPYASRAQLTGWLPFHPSAAEARQMLESAAQEEYTRTQALFRTAGYTEPPLIWHVSWQESLSKAENLLSALSNPTSGWLYAHTEYSLPRDLSCPPPLPGAGLRLQGRMDLLLSRSENGTSGELLVVDFKTGKPKDSWSLTRARKGEGLQLALYALASLALGGTCVQATLLSPGSTLDNKAPLDFELLRPTLERLLRMQQDVCFGWSGKEQEERTSSRNPLPVAVLIPEKSVLLKRAALTFPDATTPLETEEDDSEEEDEE